MVGLAQMVRASDCGPEGRRFDPDIPPHLQFAGIVQWLVCKFSKLEMRVRFSLPAPGMKEDESLLSSYFMPPVRESAKRLPAPDNDITESLLFFLSSLGLLTNSCKYDIINVAVVH